MLTTAAPPVEHATKDQAESIMIGPFEFLGPWQTIADFDDQPGIVAVLAQVGNDFQLVNLYQTADARSSAANELAGCCGANAFLLAVHYTKMSAQCRSALVQALLSDFN